jgi:LacI family transcriptional regulator
MSDIADLVGVSQATVSYVLNDHPGAHVGPTTRQRVLEAAAQLNYRPNAIARAMASGRTRTIGVYQPHVVETPLSGMWPAAVMRGIGEDLWGCEFHLLLYGYDSEEEPSPAVFCDGRVDGLIVLAPHQEDRLPRLLAEARFPLAIIGGYTLDDPNAILVEADNVEGGRKATEHLIRLGHRHIVHLQGPSDVPDAIDRKNGFIQALQAQDLPVPTDCILATGFGVEDGFRATHLALSRTPRPTAFFAANDLAALGALHACAEAGLRVPQDVAVVGYDDVPVCTLARPTLTTLAQPAQEMGRTAAELLRAVVSSEQPLERHCRFTVELIVRESCGGR